MQTEQPSVMHYDAFLSYSRRVDRALATALEQGLKTFAKPVFRRRALQIFRDDASLTASPALWASIEDALSRSRFFVLMASPASAESPWVRKELEWWLQHRSPDTLIVVLTDGVIAWNSALTTAFPRDSFARAGPEPRWVDLAWARSASDLSLRNPDFVNALAEVAGRIRGLSKDELVGEDVRQHSLQQRYVRVASAVLATLTLAALGAAGVAARRGAEAVEALALARSAAAEAQRERRAAESARDNERGARSRAETAERDAIAQKDEAVAAKELETAARKRADEERERAERERAQAFRNLVLAVSTSASLVESINTSLAQRAVPRQARLDALEIGENALWSLANQSDFHDVRRTVFTNALEKISATYHGLGARQESLRAWERVVELHRGLVKREPAFLPMQSALAASLLRLANHRLDVGDRAGHQRDLTEAAAIYRHLRTAPFVPDPTGEVTIGEARFRQIVAEGLAYVEDELRRR